MIDPPKRVGYRLTYDAECLYNEWQEIGGCSCHTGCAPCSSCCSDGNPISLEENDEAWEPNYTIEDVYNAWKLKQEKENMSRTEIKDKGGTQHESEWFGFKYRVTPDSSKLLQEAVFKDGGGWRYSRSKNVAHTDQPFLIVRCGEITYSNDEHYFETCVFLPEKQPPQPEKVFKIEKWYKCVENTSAIHALTNGKYYKCTWVSSDCKAIGVDSNTMKDSRGWKIERFDINSESDYDPNAKKELAKDVKESKLGTPKATLEAVNFVHDFKQNDFSITKEEVNMSIQNRVVSVKFFDDDAGLKAEHSLVAEYHITTRVSDAMTVSKVLLTEDVAGDIAAHNEVRAATVDLHILKQTGNKVTLQPIAFEDLRVSVTNI